MLLGFDLPTRGALASPETITRLAIEGEAMGFDYLTLSDHIVIPRDIEARYPYSTTGEFPSGGRTDWYEQLTSAAFVAAKTTRLRIGHLGDGRAASPRGADRQNARDHRPPVKRAAYRRRRRRLDEGGIRGRGHAALCRARRRHR